MDCERRNTAIGRLHHTKYSSRTIRGGGGAGRWAKRRVGGVELEGQNRILLNLELLHLLLLYAVLLHLH